MSDFELHTLLDLYLSNPFLDSIEYRELTIEPVTAIGVMHNAIVEISNILLCSSRIWPVYLHTTDPSVANKMMSDAKEHYIPLLLFNQEDMCTYSMALIQNGKFIGVGESYEGREIQQLRLALPKNLCGLIGDNMSEIDPGNEETIEGDGCQPTIRFYVDDIPTSSLQDIYANFGAINRNITNV